MTKITLLLATMTLATTSSLVSSATVSIYKSKDRLYWFEVSAVPGTQITTHSKSNLVQTFLRESAGRSAASLAVFPTREVAAWQTSTSCGRYKQWRLYFDKYYESNLSAANVIAVKNDVLLRVRDKDGLVSRQILKGEDPTTLSIEGVILEILSMSGRAVSAFEQCNIPSIAPVIYAETSGHLSLERCERITRRLADLVEATRLHVVIRNDHWFICPAMYSIAYPFKPIANPPLEQDYKRTRTISCGLSCDGRINCMALSGEAP